MPRLTLVLLLGLTTAGVPPASAQPDIRMSRILFRISEEAEVFGQMAPKMLAKETLRQRALQRPPRFRPRIGSAVAKPPKLQYRTREIVSEYSYAFLSEDPEKLHEFRQVITVDGRRIATEEEARRTLREGITSPGDMAKLKMLEKFEKHGLDGAATDFGQLILLFGKRRLQNYIFNYSGTGEINGTRALILSFNQTGGSESLLILERNKAVRASLEGQVWVRENDGLPMRINVKSVRAEDDGTETRDEASVDYTMTPHAVIAPSSVIRRRFSGKTLVVEDRFEYSQFRLFTADAELKFD